MERRAYRIVGTVQGVGFRWWTRKLANANGLRGTVRNATDGSVEILVEGEREAMVVFREQLANGPGAARVREVLEEEPGEEALPAGFEIIH